MIETASTIGLVLLGLAMALTFIRIVRGPTLADRILGLDVATVFGVGIIALYAARTGLYHYIDIAVTLALIGLPATAAFARYLLARGSQ